ncbi:hypothetical protein ACD589_15620 [Rhizobium sp. 814_E9_N1_1]|uniref:hypothetical protein n=1 Tax=unclassified Rhizobium TaxID=2613769 RepID=UPI003F1ED55E
MDSIDDFKKFIGTRHWHYAKTMPQWPHDYSVRQFNDPPEDQDLFEEAIKFIRTQGDLSGLSQLVEAQCTLTSTADSIGPWALRLRKRLS